MNSTLRSTNLHTTHTGQMQLPAALVGVATQMAEEICCQGPAKRQANLRTTQMEQMQPAEGIDRTIGMTRIQHRRFDSRKKKMHTCL